MQISARNYAHTYGRTYVRTHARKGRNYVARNARNYMQDMNELIHTITYEPAGRGYRELKNIYIYKLISSCLLVSLALPLDRFFVIPSCPSLFLSRSELFVPISGGGCGRVLMRFLLIRVFPCSPSPSRWSRAQLGFVETRFTRLRWNLLFPSPNWCLHHTHIH